LKHPYTLRRVSGYAKRTEILKLQSDLFPDDELVDPLHGGEWWLAVHGQAVAGFAGYVESRSIPGAVYLCRAGVRPEYRGAGLQRRLIQARLRHAKASGAPLALTTTFDNPASANNLIRTGFHMYTPDDPWGVDGTCYWKKNL
jgi:GNAT superfamily N-acetyltransferase